MCAHFCTIHESFSFERPPIIIVKKYFRWLYSWLYLKIYLFLQHFLTCCCHQFTQNSLQLYSDSSAKIHLFCFSVMEHPCSTLFPATHHGMNIYKAWRKMVPGVITWFCLLQQITFKLPSVLSAALIVK